MATALQIAPVAPITALKPKKTTRIKNFFALLGLQNFESDMEVTEAQIDMRMQQVKRKLNVAKDQATITALNNRLSLLTEAEKFLLDRDHRRRYIQKLEKSLN